MAAVAPPGSQAHLAVLPFLFVLPSGPLVWDLRHALRIGSELPSGRLLELEPLSRLLPGYRVQVTDVPASHPCLADWFSDLELLVVLDRKSLDTVVASCRALGGAYALPLAEALPWECIVGTPFLPFVQGLELRRARSSRSSSALRLSALMAAALEVDDGAGVGTFSTRSRARSAHQ